MIKKSNKFCKTIKGRKRCVKNKPQMNARDIIRLQMNALKKNKNESGIRLAFKYASSENKRSTGPYSKFKRMVQNKNYNHLLNCKSWKFIPKTIRKRGDEQYSVIVEVLSSHDNKKYRYRFTLSRQLKTLFWRTDSVILETYENLDECLASSSDKNILETELEICSTNPLTGYYRDGYCRTGKEDIGTHTICAEMTKEFLEFTKSQGNDLSTARGSFPGLKPGNKWCLCENRWNQAFNEKKAPPVIKEATNMKTKADIITKITNMMK
tara:strand:+ start:61 stop:861 length:801 start_codon:yes stop_codon:yes gene_type:complete